jgi:hypothetical protein
MLGFDGQNLTRAKADARGHNVAAYKIAISHWTQDATGATSFFNAFSSASGMALNVSLAVRAAQHGPILLACCAEHTG